MPENAYPLIAVAIPTSAQTWKIVCTVYITQAGKTDRTAKAGEVAVKLSKALTGLDDPIATKDTDATGTVSFDGGLTDGFYVLVATHKATGTQVSGTIRTPSTGAWGYHNPASGAPWYEPGGGGPAAYIGDVSTVS